MDNQNQPPVQTPQPEPQPTVPPVSGSKKSNLLVMGIGFIAMLAIGLTAGYFLFANKNQPAYQPQNSPTTQTTQVSPTAAIVPPSPTQDPSTTNWKSYTNPTYGFSLKYPSQNFVRIICPEDEKNNVYLVKRSTEKTDELDMPTCGRDSRFDIEIKSIPQDGATFPTSNKDYHVERTPVSISGIQGDKIISTLISNGDFPGATSWSEEIYVTHSNTTFSLYIGSKNLEPIFDKILSTFTFTNK